MFKLSHQGVLKKAPFVSHIFNVTETKLRLPRVVLANHCSKLKADLSELPPHVKINSTELNRFLKSLHGCLPRPVGRWQPPARAARWGQPLAMRSNGGTGQRPAPVSSKPALNAKTPRQVPTENKNSTHLSLSVGAHWDTLSHVFPHPRLPLEHKLPQSHCRSLPGKSQLLSCKGSIWVAGIR